MGGQRIVDVQAGFTEGLNAVSDPASLGASQARVLTNVSLTAYGSAQRRLGTQRLSAAQPNSGNPVTCGVYWPSQNKFVIGSGSNLYQGTFVSIPVTWSQVAAANGLITDGRSFVVFTDTSGNEVVYIASDNLSKLDSSGTFTGAISGTPAVTGLVVYNNRLWGWIAGSNALYFSNLASAAGSIGGDSLGVGASSGGQINVVTFGASGIYKCAVIGSSLLIFHQRGISRLTGFGLSDITVQPQAVTPDFSIVGPWAVTTYNGMGWAVGFQGLAAVTENGVQLVGTPSKPDPLPAILAANAIAANDVSVAYNPTTQEVWVAHNSGVYVYNTILGSWAGPWQNVYSTPPVNCFIQYPGGVLASSFTEPFVAFGDGLGWLLQTNIGYRDSVTSAGTGGQTYLMSVQCRRLFGQSPLEPGGARAYAKSWRWANVLAQLAAVGAGNAPVVTLSSQYGGSSTFTVSPVANVQQPYYVPAGGVGPYLDVTIADQIDGASEYAMVEVEGFYLGQR